MTGLPDDPRDDARPPGAAGDSSVGGSPEGGSAEGGSASGSSAGGPANGPSQGQPRVRGAGPEFGGHFGQGTGGDIGRDTGGDTSGDIGRDTGTDGGDVAGGSGGAVDPVPGPAFGPDADRDFGPDAGREVGRGHGGDLSRDFDAGGPDGDEPDPLLRLLRPRGDYLSPPPGSFERIRRKAARRRRNRAAAGGVVVAAMVTGSVYLAGALSPHGSGDVVGPPATSSQVTHVPTPPEPTGRTPRPSTSPPPSTTRGGRPSPVTSATTPTALPSGTSGGRAVPPTPTAATPMCTTAQLSAELGGGNAGAGNLYRYLVLTNRSATSCHLDGYPGLSLLDADGNEIGAPATRDRRPYQPVILAPGDSASDTIHTADQQGACLPTSTSLRIYPPGNRASLVITGRVTDCDNLLTITPFTAGRTGNPSN